MTIKAGEKITFNEIGVEVIVTVGGAGTLSAQANPGADLQIGKRYLCPSSGAQVLVIKPGHADLLCDGSVMELQEPKTTKAAD